MRKYLYLLGLGCTLVFAAWNAGGVLRQEWIYCLAGLTVLALLYWLTEPVSRLAPAPSGTVLMALTFLPALIAFQLLPLPLRLLRLISPARAELTDAVNRLPGAFRSFAPLSVNPAATFDHLTRIVGYLVVFLLARELSWRFGRRRTAVALPFLSVALAEAALGLAQYFGGAVHGTGTYVNPNHYAGLLEMALPFTLALAVGSFRPAMQSLSQALTVCLWCAASALLFLGSVYSLSRMGLFSAVASILVVSGLVAIRSRSRWSLLAPLLVIPILFSIPVRLLDRFSESPTGEITNEGRAQFWRETTHLIRAYPAFGSGLGTYASAIQKYRTSEPLRLLDYAHNDYLQLLAETGFVGFLPAFGIAAWLLVAAYRSALDRRLATKDRYLAIACAASLSALALHSMTDFNLYIPANAMVAAWIAGLLAGIAVGPGLSGNLTGHQTTPRTTESRSTRTAHTSQTW